MAEIVTSYPFDPTGASPDNLIVGERHVVNTNSLADYHFIVPKFAPFFRLGMTIKNLSTGNTLIEGVDWVASHHFISASRSTARPIYGSITFLDKTLSGALELQYQTLGGDWNIGSEDIMEIVMNRLTNPRITTWEEVTNYPVNFPAIDHQWHLNDMVGMNEVKQAINDVALAIDAKTNISDRAIAHYNDFNNPHNVNKIQVGLSEVENYAPSTEAQAQVGTANNLYMTPLTTKAAIERFANMPLNEFMSRTDNPHAVTKAQVGLEFVHNFPVASVDDAALMTRSDRYMTPTMTKVSIETLLANYYTKQEVIDLVNNAYGLDNFNVDLGNLP